MHLYAGLVLCVVTGVGGAEETQRYRQFLENKARFLNMVVGDHRQTSGQPHSMPAIAQPSNTSPSPTLTLALNHGGRQTSTCTTAELLPAAPTVIQPTPNSQLIAHRQTTESSPEPPRSDRPGFQVKPPSIDTPVVCAHSPRQKAKTKQVEFKFKIDKKRPTFVIPEKWAAMTRDPTSVEEQDIESHAWEVRYYSSTNIITGRILNCAIAGCAFLFGLHQAHSLQQPRRVILYHVSPVTVCEAPQFCMQGCGKTKMTSNANGGSHFCSGCETCFSPSTLRSTDAAPMQCAPAASPIRTCTCVEGRTCEVGAMHGHGTGEKGWPSQPPLPHHQVLRHTRLCACIFKRFAKLSL